MTTSTRTRTAVIAVHLQNDVVGADGAFARLLPRRDRPDRRPRPRSAALLDAARAAGVHGRLHPRRLAARLRRPASPTRPCSASSRRPKCLVDGSHGAEIVDELSPQDSDSCRHPPAGRRIPRQPTGRRPARRGDRHRRLRRRGHQRLRRRHRPRGLRPGLPHGHRRRRLLAPPTPAAHAASLESLGLLAEITTTDELLGRPGRTAGHGHHVAAVTP